jgi:hypothetical protein
VRDVGIDCEVECGTEEFSVGWKNTVRGRELQLRMEGFCVR